MKKLLILLLVMVIGAGAVFAAANPNRPSGELYPEMTGAYSLEAALAEYGVQQGVVTQPSDLAVAVLGIARPPSLQAVMANDYFIAIRTQSGFIIITDLESNDQASAAVDFYLRL